MKNLKRWQEPIYALGAFGPIFLYQIVMVYLTNYYHPEFTQVEAGALIFAPASAMAFGMVIARVFDALVKIPIALWTDNLKTRWGRRRPLMILGGIPALFSFLLLWYPPITGSRLGPDGHWGNAVFIVVVTSIYFFFHSLIILPYLASLSELLPGQESRVRVASWQSAYIAAGFLLTLVVAPVLFERWGVRGTIWLFAPAFLSFLGPILVVDESSSIGTKPNRDTKFEGVPLLERVKSGLASRTFWSFMIPVVAFTFGLQFFLGGITLMGVNMMGLSETQTRWIILALFAPLPIMLVSSNRLIKTRGAEWTFKFSLLVFAAAMLLFPLGWTRLNFPISPSLVGIIAGIIGSFSVGVFFSTVFAFPAQVAAEEAEKTGQDRAGMYYAVVGVIIVLIGAVGRTTLTWLFKWRYAMLVISPLAALISLLAYFFYSRYFLKKAKS